MAAEAVLCVGAAGSGAPRKGDYRLPGAAEETGAKGGKTAYAAWAGTAQRSERRTDADAGYSDDRELALPFELRYDATTLMRSANRRSLRPVYTDFVCANSAGALCPGSPEGFAAFQLSTDRSVSEDRTETEMTQGLEE